MADRVRVASDMLSAEIDCLGAELVRLTTAAGDELLWDGDPAWWSGRAPILFPIVGALANGRYRLDGREFALPQHGFARKSLFERVEAGDRTARLRLTDTDATRAAYPFAFVLDMTFAIDGATLTMTATVANRDERPLPFSFGFHPALRWPLPGGGAKTDHRLLFEHDEPTPIRGVAAGLLSGDLPSPVAGRVLALDESLFAHDALVWDRLTSRALRFEGADGIALDIGFPDTPHLGVWTKPGADFLCIEPWRGHADPVGYDGDIFAKPGIVTLAPGATASFRMTIGVTAA